MFTIQEIQAAHSKVKTGADFPAYAKNIKTLGVTHYETFVADGHTDYYGVNNFCVTSPRRYAELQVSKIVEADQFSLILQEHQQGKSDFNSFIGSCAKFGIAKWKVSLQAMTCTYFDDEGRIILTEHIPG